MGNSHLRMNLLAIREKLGSVEKIEQDTHHGDDLYFEQAAIVNKTSALVTVAAISRRKFEEHDFSTVELAKEESIAAGTPTS